VTGPTAEDVARSLASRDEPVDGEGVCVLCDGIDRGKGYVVHGNCPWLLARLWAEERHPAFAYRAGGEPAGSLRLVEPSAPRRRRWRRIR